jgi:hypothetical protein
VDATVDTALASPAFKMYLENQWRAHEIPIYIYRTPLSEGLVDLASKVNFLAQKGYDDGCDYLAFGLSDLVFSRPGWDKKFVTKLRTKDGFGWAGENTPPGVSYLNVCTRRHMDIFGFFVPPLLKNWYIDDWLRDVYGQTRMAFTAHQAGIAHAHVIHPQHASSRYQICHAHRQLYQQQVKNAQPLIEEARRNPVPYSVARHGAAK